jgi:hypothetical protein
LNKERVRGGVWRETPLTRHKGRGLFLTALDKADRYAALDLSACGMGAGVTEFDPDSSISADKDRIVSLVLPDTAKSIKTLWADPAFNHFTSLTRVSGEVVTTVGEWAFTLCTRLASVSFPAAETIGMHAFAVR